MPILLVYVAVLAYAEYSKIAKSSPPLVEVSSGLARMSFSGSEAPETIRCDETVHRYIFRRQFTDIIEESSSTDIF